MTHTDSIVVLCDYMFNLLDANKKTLGLADVWYGDQEKIPRTPAGCVEPVDKKRMIQGAASPGGMSLNVFTIMVLLYHNKVQDTATTRREVDVVAEAVEALLHSDPTLGGLVIHGFVQEFESGYTYRTGTQYRSTRLTWYAQTKTHLTPSS